MAATRFKNVDQNLAATYRKPHSMTNYMPNFNLDKYLKKKTIGRTNCVNKVT